MSNLDGGLHTDLEIAKAIGGIAHVLPDEPARIWSKDPDEILCENEQIAETLADLFDAMYGEPTVNTGYYDPAEDEQSGEADERTGYWYVSVG